MRDTWFVGISFALIGYWGFDRLGLAIGFITGVFLGAFIEMRDRQTSLEECGVLR